MPGAGTSSNVTVIGLIESITGRSAVEADQSITVETVGDEVASHIKVGAGEPVLRIDRLYLDAEGTPLELAINRFHPGHYSYRVRLKRHGR
jgi:DNA-binding GntR family transcriptional regulator